ncbi:hypothetical protein KUTeg_002062 [Tegillarca granosa]|uniref:Transmembrane protein 26 n=1 Tax=Tegillarca granosa TaxID=220873 RepID=A0ABQ9FXK8_TEGGR|nr:hypothetical protein KUTeg_002062 [Tegillarca granosa]
MRCVTIIRALLVRIMFAGHGVIAIWRLYMVIQETWCWYLSGAIGFLVIETIVTLYKNNGKEWKWFCPSVFFYLGSVVPSIWFLELHQINEGLKAEGHINVTLVSLPLALTPDLWLRVIEQFLLLMLIIGRWLLPKGALSHDQLSQLLLVYVGTAADIVEFYESFNEEGVKSNLLLCYIILGIWTLSLLQFTLVLTATRARRDQVGAPGGMDVDSSETSCCNAEIYGIITSILMQDCPFLVVRLLLIFKYKIVSYTNMFFTSKNSLVIILLLYRVCVVNIESRRRKKHIDGSPLVQRMRMIEKKPEPLKNFVMLNSSQSRSVPNVNKIYESQPNSFYNTCPQQNSAWDSYK